MTNTIKANNKKAYNEKNTKNKLKVTYVKSAIGYNKNQRKVLEALGLTKLNDSNVLPDNASVRGAIFKIKHLLSVETIEK